MKLALNSAWQSATTSLTIVVELVCKAHSQCDWPEGWAATPSGALVSGTSLPSLAISLAHGTTTSNLVGGASPSFFQGELGRASLQGSAGQGEQC